MTLVIILLQLKTRGLVTVCLASTLVSPVATHEELTRGHGGEERVGRVGRVGRAGSWKHASIEVTSRQHRTRDRDMLGILVTPH